MKVKALVAHDNEYGVSDGSHDYHKQVGAVYEIESDEAAEGLIALKVVEKHSSERKTSS